MSPFEAHRLKQAHDRFTLVRPESDRALADLRRRGVEVEIIGSLVRGDFKIHSDVDFLIHDTAGLSDGAVYDIITNHVKTARIDMIFSQRQSAKSLAILRQGASA